MRLFILGITSLLGLAVSVPFSWAQGTGSGLIAPERARRYGLERAWFTQVQVDPARGRIQHVRLHVSSTQARTSFEVTTKTGRHFVFSELARDIFGDVIGVEGARKKAAEKQRKLQAAGIESRTEEHVVPEITLYVSTNRGLIQAIDAETGKTRWATAVGSPDYPTFEPAISDDFVVMVNGSFIYVLNAQDGRPIWQRKAHGVPAAGAAINRGYVFVPCLHGNVEGYGLHKDANKWPIEYWAYGMIHAQPTVAGNRVFWPTDRGDINAVTVGRRNIRFRLRTNNTIVGRITFAPPRQLFAVTENGYLYSFDAGDGSMLWRFSTGEETSQSPSVVDKHVHVLTKHAGMYCVDIKTGMEHWWAPEMQQFAAASKTRVYGTNQVGQMIILNRRDGGLVGRIPTVVTDYLFVNSQTDRIYIASSSGLLQCVREIGAEWPVLHISAAEAASEKLKTPKKVAPPAQKPAVAPVDPFAGGAAKPASKPVAKPDVPPVKTPPTKADEKADDNPFG